MKAMVRVVRCIVKMLVGFEILLKCVLLVASWCLGMMRPRNFWEGY
jgi:hypothetical protein